MSHMCMLMMLKLCAVGIAFKNAAVVVKHDNTCSKNQNFFVDTD